MHRTISFTLATALAACTSSSSPPTREQYDDTAQAIASTTAPAGGGGDVASMSDTVAISLGSMPPGFTLMGNGTIQGSRLGVEFSYAITCKNAAGAVNLCGPLTDQASVDVSWSGNLDTANVDASVERSGSWSVTGLQTATATFNGDSSFSFDATVTGPLRTATYAFDASAEYDEIRISTQQKKIIDGSASFDVSAESRVTGAGGNSAEASFEVHAEITFHADGTADLVLDGTQRYSLNLSTGVVVRAN